MSVDIRRTRAEVVIAAKTYELGLQLTRNDRDTNTKASTSYTSILTRILILIRVLALVHMLVRSLIPIPILELVLARIPAPALVLILNTKTQRVIRSKGP